MDVTFLYLKIFRE